MLVPIKETGTVVQSLSVSNDRTIKAAELDQNNPKCNLRDIPKTLEALETLGVPVIGYKTDIFPLYD